MHSVDEVQVSQLVSQGLQIAPFSQNFNEQAVHYVDEMQASQLVWHAVQIMPFE